MDLPDEKIMCHHTGFEKSCFDMVTKCKCRKWVSFIGAHPQTGAEVNVTDCRDHLEHLFWVEAARQQRGTTASVDKLATEVAKANDAGVGSALMGLNSHLRVMQQRANDPVFLEEQMPLQLTGGA